MEQRRETSQTKNRAEDRADRPPAARSMPAVPYPGLRPFLDADSAIFFGRRAHWQAILERLARTRFVPVLGPSGSGKSSLIRAGVIPALKAGRFYAAGTSWRVAVMRPENSPIWNLAKALSAMLVDIRSPGEDAAPDFSEIQEISSWLHVKPEVGLLHP